ncbi:MAG: hypothetical protein GKR93_14540 [Gammaproteobacteria bacterium]|nr:hypothetical protein [Gammaproteobacteria bacterium]
MNHIFLKAILFVVFISTSTIPSTVLAASSAAELIRYRIFSESIQNLDSGLIDNEFTSHNTQVNFELSEDKKNGTLRIGGWNNPSNKFQYSLEFKTPLEKEQNAAVLGDLKGLFNATTIAVKLDYRSINKLTFDDQNMFNLCEKFMLPSYTKNSGCSATEVEAAAKKYISSLSGNEGKLIKAKLCSEIDIYGDDCSADNYSKKWKKIYQSKRSITANVTGTIFGVRIEGGNEKFSFLVPANLTKSSADETPYAISINGGRIFGKNYVGGGYRYERGYKAQKSIQVCQPLANASTTTSCESGAFGSPLEQERHNVYAEWRFKLPNEKIAFSPRVTVDLEEGEYGFDMPIYLTTTEKHGLSGGVRLGWSSESDDVTGTVFFGSTFKYFD